MEFVTSSLQAALAALHLSFGSLGLAIAVFAMCLRAVLLPIQVFNFRQQRLIKKIEPELERFKAKYKDDPMRLFQESGALKKREGVKSGVMFFASLAQMPVFISTYRVFSTMPALSGGSLLWLTTLAAPDPYFIFPLVVALTSYLQLAPSASAAWMKYLPLVSLVFMAAMPSGLVFYYAVSGVLQFTGDQILKRIS